MQTHVVIGAGPIGRGIAGLLSARGDRVVLASRSGTSAPPAGGTGTRIDATDTEAVTRLVDGADTLVNAINPRSYATWERDWPPVAASLLAAAEKTGAGLLTVSNLYGYGPVEGAMTEETPLAAIGTKGRVRARMWQDALAAHRDGRVRAAELRPSDYFGAGAGRYQSMLNEFVITRAAAGRTVRMISGLPDVPHSWSYLPDIAALGAALATDDRGWGRAWHVPTEPPRTVRDVAADTARIAGVGPVRVGRVPRPIRTALRIVPTIRELDETAYQFERPFVLDSSAAQETFGLQPTPWEEALETTISELRGRR